MLRRLLLFLTRDYSCRRFVARVTEYLEGTMPAKERKRVERHLRECGDCERYLAQMRTTIELTGRLRARDVDALPADARARLLEAFERSCGS